MDRERMTERREAAVRLGTPSCLVCREVEDVCETIVVRTTLASRNVPPLGTLCLLCHACRILYGFGPGATM